MKTIDLVRAYKVAVEAKLSKMADDDKMIVIKAILAMKPIATAFDEFVKLSQEKLKGDDFEEMQKKAQQWQKEGDKTTLTQEERKAINDYFNSYYKSVNDCVNEEAEKEQALDYARLKEDAFKQLIASNDFKVSVILDLQDALME